jgi:hypothetical protein
MKLREMVMIVGGLMIGLAVGVLLIGSDESLRTSLFGTAGNTTVPMSYYLADAQMLHDWLLGNQPDASLQTAFDQVSAVATASDFRKAVQDSQSSISSVLDQSFSKLFGSSAPAQAVACLGVNDNSESAPEIDLYVALPQAQASIIPAGWTKLDNPKPEDLYWESIACHPESAQ